MQVTGSLGQVLQISKVVWYHGEDGQTCYIECPIIIEVNKEAKGLVAINGKQIMRLIDGGSSRISDSVINEIKAHGVKLDQRWTCAAEMPPGMDINVAVAQSRFEAVRHFAGRVAIQCHNDNYRLPEDQQMCTIFLDGEKRWEVKMKDACKVIAELGLLMWCGWFPCQENLLYQQDEIRAPQRF